MRIVRRTLAAIVLLLLAHEAHAAPIQITYILTPVPPRADAEARTEMQVVLAGLQAEKTVRLQMPVWSPGDYHVQNHAKYVRNLNAQTDRGEMLTVTHPDANTWEVQTGGANIAYHAVIVTYALPNTPPGFFSENVKVTERYAFYNGPATYLYVVGHKEDPAALHVRFPEGWTKAITPLDARKEDSGPTPRARFSAPDYDTLADSPVLVGDFVTRQFAFAGRPHTVAFFGAHEGMDYDSLLPILGKVVAEENRLMGGPPYKQYVFFFDVNGRGGGLEHLNSHRLSLFKGIPPRFLAGGVAHEFFHLWNVKRIRPAVLGPFDYINPPRTRNLWFSEGVTSYYGDLSLRRAGLRSEGEYLDGLAGAIQSLQSIPARKRVTADEASLKVWDSGGSQGYGGLSYYLKGELIGLCLDLKIRGVTGNRRSLDDVMRDLMARHGLPKPGVPEDGIREAVVRAAGPELGPFYDLLCRSTEEMPFAECLRYAGLRLVPGERGDYRIERDANASADAKALRADWLKERTAERSARSEREEGEERDIARGRAEEAQSILLRAPNAAHPETGKSNAPLQGWGANKPYKLRQLPRGSSPASDGWASILFSRSRADKLRSCSNSKARR